MHTKESLKKQLAAMGLTGEETILIHSSMKAIGETQKGAETVLDALMEFFEKGLLLLPTHTWKTINAENPVFDVDNEPACVGILSNLFLKRPGVIRSLHPTHSMAGYGKDAASYLAGEEMRNTPCTPGGCYDRLKDVGGKILLVEVGHERNTYIHSVEEVLNVPNRLSDMPVLMKIVKHGKKPVSVYMRKHYNSQQPHISENFVKLNRAFDECGATVHTVFGSAECILCDARRIFEVTRHVLAPDPECLVTGGEIAPERWQELIK